MSNSARLQEVADGENESNSKRKRSRQNRDAAKYTTLLARCIRLLFFSFLFCFVFFGFAALQFNKACRKENFSHWRALREDEEITKLDLHRGKNVKSKNGMQSTRFT